MENSSVCFGLNDINTSDVTIRLRNNKGKPELFYSHSSILKEKSKYFADKLVDPNCGAFIDIHCSHYDYEHHVDLLKRLYLSKDSLLESWDSVHSALGVLQLAVEFNCREITESCVQYLEAVPWEDKEEDLILKVVPKLGPVAMSILARVQPVDFSATKNVFISAIRFATSVVSPSPPFGDELKTSAQEQVEYMLGDDDEEIPLVIADEEVKSESKKGLKNIWSSFDKDLSCLVLQTDDESAEKRVMQSLSDLGWICNVLSKMDLMKEFVDQWIDFSSRVIRIMDDKLLESNMYGVKLKIIELTWKVLDAVGYGNVIVPPARRVELVTTWLPFIRKTKPVLDSIGNEETGYPYKMDDDLCQNIEGAIVALLSALPSNDQADILADWMNEEQLKYPDLSEAFEIWCYRTKSARRRLVEGLDRVGKATVSL
ncbi:putative chromatin remodeling & transcription regulator BTB-POZ family [Helianthus annuus]|nr:putative chromatin remodeling & transcription regulator BTB-POZ family [Helianthus annuus]KAJ0634632.1 putative chromatin remodeling & transcription regulator BTB-POZ family [Helianthus annuus]KAJ0811240.1 putative chromatin remodeling & transcription regulator BTB-POZ family [Helianthus annuus]